MFENETVRTTFFSDNPLLSVGSSDWGITFASVCRFDNQRLLLAIAAAKGWRVTSLDVQTAFLN